MTNIEFDITYNGSDTQDKTDKGLYQIDGITLTGGCPGQNHLLSIMAEMLPLDEFYDICIGIRCKPKDTSCADQFAKAINYAIQEVNND